MKLKKKRRRRRGITFDRDGGPLAYLVIHQGGGSGEGKKGTEKREQKSSK